MKCQECGVESPEGKRFCGDCGAGLPQPLSEEQPRSKERSPYVVKINVLCLVGVVFAVVSLFLPWAEATTVYFGQVDTKTIGAFEFDEPLVGTASLDGYGWFPNDVRASVTLFMIGAVLCLLTPLGAFPLALGAGGFLLTLPLEVYGYEIIPGVGAIVAVFSSAIVILSFPKILTPPAWDKIVRRRIDWWLTWSKGK